MYFVFVLLLQEDIGGPLTTIYCPRTLVGIVSFGPRRCGRVNYPAVYTRVSAVYDWIIQFAPEGKTNPGEMH
jgi:secreted trypsin-like serine protease